MPAYRYEPAFVAAQYDRFAEGEWLRLTSSPIDEVNLHIHAHYLRQFVPGGARVLWPGGILLGSVMSLWGSSHRHLLRGHGHPPDLRRAETGGGLADPPVREARNGEGEINRVIPRGALAVRNGAEQWNARAKSRDER